MYFWWMKTWVQPPLPTRFSDGGDPTFVGRSKELDILESIWDGVATGQRRAVFITGEPGSGKSRLVSVLARALHKEGCTVLLGTASADLGYPYRPFVEALNQVFTSFEPGDLDDVLPDTAGELARLTPEVTKHRDNLEISGGERQEYRRELFDAVVDFSEALAHQAPLVLVLEDLHWSTAPTRLLLTHLIQTTDESPILIIGTFRNTAPDRSDDLSFAIADLYRLNGVDRIDLTGLEVADIELYLKGETADAESGKELSALLRDLTGGNPFFLRELWREISKRGGITSLRRDDFAAPSSVKETLEKRIRSFTAAERSTIEFAAVAGDSFSPGALVAASAQSMDETMTSIDTAIEHGLLRAGPEPGEFSFQHALVRQAVLDGVSSSRSAQIHADMATSIAPLADDRPGLAPVLARLYLGARSLGFQEECARYLSIAAEQAERSLAHEEAADLWLQAAKTELDQESSQLAELRAANCYVRAADFARARETFSRLTESQSDYVAIRAAIGFEDASWRVGLPGFRARNLLEAAVGRMEEDPSDPLYIHAISSLGRAYAWTGDHSRAIDVGTKAIEMAKAIGDDSLICETLHASMRVITPAQRVSSYDLAVELRELAMKTGNYEALAQAGAFRVITSYMAGRPAEWMGALDDITRSIDVTGSRFWLWVQESITYVRHFMRGDFEQASTTAERALELGYEFGTDDTEGPYGIQMYVLNREMATLEPMRPLLSGDPIEDGSWAPGLLAIYTELGMLEPAEQLLWSLVETEGGEQQTEAVWPAVIAFMCEAALRLGKPELLARVRSLASEFGGYGLIAGAGIAVFGSADRYLAQIDAALGDHHSAEELFRNALDMDTRMQSLVHQAETMARYSLFLTERAQPGDLELAASYREKALDLARPRGQMRVVRLFDQPDGYGLPDGLTPREVDVLRLLAAGATNREIGAELYISQNTAANHVRNILIKTMATNRTQAAIYAAEKGLLD